jgi:RNA polymerase sigma factor (sigma-70 family)
MDEADSRPPRWAQRLQEMGRELRSCPTASVREATREEIWRVLNLLLFRYLRFHASRLGRFSEEDIEDIASKKSLDFVEKLDKGQWDLSEHSPAELPRILSATARNGLVDHLREGQRWAEPIGEERPGKEREVIERAHDRSRPDTRIEQHEFALALKRCAELLDERSRFIWFLRVFYEMRSKDIGAHVEVNLKPPHVNVILQRARNAVRRCMHQRGFDPQDIPPGTFAHLWSAFRLERPAEQEETV